MSKIRVLPESVARKIAAGEVIERPASVVKELVENSLDAGARQIVVEIEQGGRARIAVTDDGEGMSREDAMLAFEPYATSKICDAEDLTRIATLGFRGEALPSIAAVAGVELWTCRRGDPAGTHVRVHGGKPVVVEDVGTAAGCRIEVDDLFASTPARRKFLKAPVTEAGHVAQVVSRLAVARSDVGFELRQDGRHSLTFSAAPLRERIRQVLGAEIAHDLRPVDGDGAVALSGFVTDPRSSLANTRSTLFFVNGRLVRDRLLQHALMSAYATLIPNGRYPGAVLFLSIAAEQVDVNVHPTKLEVRFRDGHAVHSAITQALRSALGSGRSGLAARNANRETLPLVEREGTSRSCPGRVAETSPAYSPPTQEESTLRLVPVPETGGAQLPLSAIGDFSELRVLGQIFDGYLVCEGDDDLVLIDQHAAHERVAFERLKTARRDGRVETQAMLVAEPIELAAGEAELLAAVVDELAACGLELEGFGERAVLVRAIPALLPPRAIVPLVRAIAADLAETERSRALESRLDALLATVACHSVVRVGQKLSDVEMRGLLAAMDSVDLNSNCPHGRPVARRISRAELERRFGRQ